VQGWGGGKGVEEGGPAGTPPPGGRMASARDDVTTDDVSMGLGPAAWIHRGRPGQEAQALALGRALSDTGGGWRYTSGWLGVHPSRQGQQGYTLAWALAAGSPRAHRGHQSQPWSCPGCTRGSRQAEAWRARGRSGAGAWYWVCRGVGCCC